MSKQPEQLDLLGLSSAPAPLIAGLHWHKPDGSPLLLPNGLPAKYEYQGVVWSGRGRMPRHWPKFRSIADGKADIEASMVKRGYRRANP